MVPVHRLTGVYASLQGGLFASVDKADVGEGVANLMGQGCDILAWADPYFPDPSMPPSVVQAMSEALASGVVSHYTMPIGDTELRRALAEKLRQQNGLTVDGSRNVLVTPGSDSGLLYAMMPFLGVGDEVMIPDPSYPSNFGNCRLLGAKPVAVPLDAAGGYQFDIAQFEARVTPRTKMVLITHPNNPTSTIFRRENLEALGRFVIRHDLILVVDQAFEDLIYDGLEFVTPATLPGLFERTVTVFSFSKGLGLSGLRVGYLVTNDRFMDVYYGAAVNVLGATNTLAQKGALAALRDPSILHENYRVFEERRRRAYRAFSSVPGVKATRPESGILSWLDVSSLGGAEVVCRTLLDEARVVVNDGHAYGELGRDHIRIVHGCMRDETKADAAFERIRAVLHRLAVQKGIARPSA